MKRCRSCGVEVKDRVRKCPRCGGKDWQDPEDDLKDYWAERLTQNTEEDWLQDVPEEDLPDINEDRKETDEEKKIAAEKEKKLLEKMRAVQPGPAPKSVITWIILLILGVVVLFAVIRYGKSQEIDYTADAGMYYGCSRYSQGGKEKNPEDWLELYPDGYLRLSLDGLREEGSWKVENGKFSGIYQDRTLTGSVGGGILTLYRGNTKYVFARYEQLEKQIRTEFPVTVTVPQEDRDYHIWEGDYYGSMVLSQGTGAFAGNDEECYSVCGQILLEEDDRGRLSLWNEANKPGDRFCIADVIFTEGTTEMGKLYAEWGSFNGMEIGPGEWVMDPGKSPVSHLKNLLYLRGNYLDPGSPQDSFTYEIFLRPWGEDWQDVFTAYEDPWMVPPDYESWYLPLQKAGMQMPDHF